MINPLSSIAVATGPIRDRVHVPSAFRYPDYRNYWFGLLASVTSYQMLFMFCLGWLVFDITGDTRTVGYMSAAMAGPTILLNLFGGVLADKLNPKRLMGLTQCTTAAIIVGLGVLTLRDAVELRHVVVAAFIMGAVLAFDEPCRQTIYPRLIPRNVLPNAVALNSVIWTGTRVIGAPLAGLIIGISNISTVIFICAGGFVALGLIVQTVNLRPLERTRGAILQEMMTGFKFIRRNSVFSFLIVMTFFNSMFGMSYFFLMPVIANEVLHVGAGKIGVLMGASGIGSLAGVAIFVALGTISNRGRLIIGGAICFGSALMLFALTAHFQSYELSMVVLFASGIANSLYLMAVMTTLHTLVPDNFRGRVMGFYTITWSIILLGGFQANQIAYYINPPAAIAIGGGLVVAFALWAATGNRLTRAIDSAAVLK